MSRSITPRSEIVNPIVSIANFDTNATAIIIVVTIISATAIGGSFFLRKRKED